MHWKKTRFQKVPIAWVSWVMYDSRVFLLTLMPIVRAKGPKIKEDCRRGNRNTVWKNRNFKEIDLDPVSIYLPARWRFFAQGTLILPAVASAGLGDLLFMIMGASTGDGFSLNADE